MINQPASHQHHLKTAGSMIDQTPRAKDEILSAASHISTSTGESNNTMSRHLRSTPITRLKLTSGRSRCSRSVCDGLPPVDSRVE